jgi:TPR repeat protein
MGGFAMRRGLSFMFALALLSAAGASVAEACPLATDNKGNYSPTEHIRCLRQAAEQGDFLSQHLLGMAYFVGDETPQDYDEAAKWFHRSADQGDPTSQFMLSAMYVKGEGVPKDIVQAYMWLILSAAQGIAQAREARDILAKKMTTAQIIEAQKLAREWKPKPEQ